MRIGVSVACLYPMKTEEAFLHCAQLGIDTIEIFFNSACELDGPVLEKIKAIQKEYNIFVPAVHPFTSFAEPYFLFSAYERRFHDAREAYKRYYETAAALGAEVVVLHGDTGDTCSLEEYCRRFALLREDAAQCGICLAQENVVRYRSGDPHFIRGMREILQDNVEFVLDIKQARRAGYSPFALWEAMGDRLRHIHLSDHNDQHSCMLPGEGNFDFRKLGDLLRKQNYSGSAVLELYREDFTEISSLGKSVQFLKENIGRSA